MAEHRYHGKTIGIPRNPENQITYQGCLAVCGYGSEYYPWGEIASTITTWTLPVIGVILQAPFQSNQFWDTVFTLARWIGNPIASISYTLWNIKVTGKCALLLELSVCAHERASNSRHLDSDFAEMRDSLYILASMNQFSVHPDVIQVRQEAETLLRIALFSKGLHYAGSSQRFLSEHRRTLAATLRKTRKRGVVPVFISTMWFLFSLAISIQGAFDLIGTNATAHDLALGLLLGWLPVLFLTFIVDRNFTNPEGVQDALNKLVEEVRQAVKDPMCRANYVDTYQGRTATEIEKQLARICDISGKVDKFFVQFAGQGRVRWHYGVAHPILTDIEKNHIKAHGRGWLSADEQIARVNLVLGNTNKRGLIWFDFRELWQIGSAFLIVFSTVAGAWILSFFTPTVGLGCRSGGYTVFFVMATCTMLLELMIWITTAADEGAVHLRHYSTNRRHRSLDKFCGSRIPTAYLITAAHAIDTAFVRIWLIATRTTGEARGSARRRLEARQHALRSWSLRRWADTCVLRPLEIANTLWLLYIVMAQTVGSFNNCYCQSSMWARGGGYIDFGQYSFATSPWLQITWPVGATVACTALGLSMFYIVVEWCLQSHLSTENYEDAVRGVRRTRQFRRLTYPYRWATDKLSSLFFTRKGVMWTYEAIHEESDPWPGQRRRLLSIPASHLHTLPSESSCRWSDAG